MPLSFAGRRVTVMGLGTFGGGLGAVRFLVSRGAVVTVTDLRSAAELSHSLKQLSQFPPAHFRLGGHDPRDFEEADMVVASPAVPRDNPCLVRASLSGVTVTSEIELFWQLNRGQVLAVTGSNGKSTTTALAHTILSTACQNKRLALPGSTGLPARQVWLGGNIGHSLLPYVDAIHPTDWVVLELSSFQLEALAHLLPRPRIAVVTNFSSNHLDRHGTLGAYRTAKQNLLRHQQSCDWTVRNADDTDVASWPSTAQSLWFSFRELDGAGVFWDSRRQLAIGRMGRSEWHWPVLEWSRLPGQHNLANLLAALAATLPVVSDEHDLQSAISGFRGLPHRLEVVAQYEDLRFVNDSKSTTPTATTLAVAAFRDPVVLLAGGYDKQIDLFPLAQCAAEPHVAGMALLGQVAPCLSTLIDGAKTRHSAPHQIFADLASAFVWSIDQLPKNPRGVPYGVVLLSPGCASYDWFENYEARGERFRSLAQAWVAQAESCNA